MFEGWEVNGSPVAGTRERIEGMMTRFGELTDEVGRLEGLVEDQRRDLEMQNSSRMGGMYDDEDGVVTQTMVDEEEEQVRALEDKIKAMQVKVHIPLLPKFWRSLTLVDC
jgi:DASH complex subunit Spc34